MTSGNELTRVLRDLVEQEVAAQLQRHQASGNAISRQRAIEMAIKQTKDTLLLQASQSEKKGEDDQADIFRALAQMLPELLREQGVR